MNDTAAAHKAVDPSNGRQVQSALTSDKAVVDVGGGGADNLEGGQRHEAGTQYDAHRFQPRLAHREARIRVLRPESQHTP